MRGLLGLVVFALVPLPAFSQANGAQPLSAVRSVRKASKMQPEKVVAEMKRSVFHLLATDFTLPVDSPEPLWCSGTAFLVNDQGYLITNAHVLRNAERQCHVDHQKNKMHASFLNESTETRTGVPVDLVAVDEQYDLAILKIATWDFTRKNSPELKNVVFRTGMNPDGMSVAFTGYPFLHRVPLSQFGVVSGQVNDRFVAGGPIVKTLVVNQPANSGSSGSPLYFVETGEVIGVINADTSVALRTLDGRTATLFQHSGFCIAIKSEHIVRFLREHRVNFHVIRGAK